MGACNHMHLGYFLFFLSKDAMQIYIKCLNGIPQHSHDSRAYFFIHGFTDPPTALKRGRPKKFLIFLLKKIGTSGVKKTRAWTCNSFGQCMTITQDTMLISTYWHSSSQKSTLICFDKSAT